MKKEFNPLTLEDFKKNIDHSGESVMMAAFYAQRVEDDPELQAKAKELIRLEDEFDAMLDERGIVR